MDDLNTELEEYNKHNKTFLERVERIAKEVALLAWEIFNGKKSEDTDNKED